MSSVQQIFEWLTTEKLSLFKDEAKCLPLKAAWWNQPSLQSIIHRYVQTETQTIKVKVFTQTVSVALDSDDDQLKESGIPMVE